METHKRIITIVTKKKKKLNHRFLVSIRHELINNLFMLIKKNVKRLQQGM